MSQLNKSEMDRPGLVRAGHEIEVESFRIIDSEIGAHDFSPDQWSVVRRIIHTTGDFDYASRVRFHPLAIEAGIRALQKGASIFTDTRMVRVGLSPWRLEWFGNNVSTPVVQKESQQWAEAMGSTRSVAAFRHCSTQLEGAIVAIGNAPTALIEVIRLIVEDGVRPALVIGAPVGFVQAAESKEMLLNVDGQPFITVRGRKGGSAVAVAILHALLEWAKSSNK